ncbi:MAG: hypothetical protein QN120_03210 [Armatimonadota bacterium]|nr:hypothetical protein [Armatimonadota bacterium]
MRTRGNRSRLEQPLARRLLIPTMLVAIVLGLTGDAAASHTGLLFGAPTRIKVTMAEYSFTPATITVKAGAPLDLILENKGSIAHTFMVYRKPKTEHKGTSAWWEYALANTYLQNIGEIMVHDRGVFVVSGTSVAEVSLEPGQKVTVTFTPSRKGAFEFGCHLATGGGGSHYKAGMKGTLVVK